MPISFSLPKQSFLAAVIAALVFIALWCGIFFRGFDQPLFAPALLLVHLAAFILLAPGLRQGWAFPASPLTALLLSFWLWIALSLAWSDVPFVSTIFVLTIGSLPLLFFSVLQHPDKDRLIGGLWVGLTASIAVLAIWAVVQYLFLQHITGSRIHHPMLNANNLAVILSMGFFLLLMLFSRGGKGVQIFTGILMVLVTVGIMATQSRGGSLGCLAGTAVFTVLCWGAIRKKPLPFALLFSVLAVVVSAILLYSYIEWDGEVRLIGGAGAAASNENRFFLLGSAWKMLQEQWFLGPGLGVFYLVFPPFRHLEDISDGYFLHIDPLQFGIETGIVATLLFYSFGIAVLVRMIRALLASKGEDVRRLQLVTAFCGLLSLMINTHVNFDLYMLPALLFGAILLMGWYRESEKILGEKTFFVNLRHKAYLVFAVPALALLFIMSPLWLVRAGIAVEGAEKAAAALHQGDLEKAQQLTDYAARIGPDSYYRIYYIDALWRGRILQDRFYALEAGQRQELFDSAMRSIDLSLRYNPYNIQALSHQAMLYYVAYPRLDADGVDHAIATLQRALAIDPVSFDIRMGLARMYELQNRVQAAIDVLEEGNRWTVTQLYAPPFYLQMLAGLKEKAGDHAAAARLREDMQVRANEMSQRIQAFSAVDQWIDEKINLLKR